MADTDTIAAPDLGSGSVPGGDSSALGGTPPIVPPPDNSGSPLSSIPSRASSDLTPSPLPAAPAPPVNPKLNRTFLSTLKGLALGFLQGNVVGAVQGAIDPQVPQRVLQQQRQVMTAQVADTVNK